MNAPKCLEDFNPENYQKMAAANVDFKNYVRKNARQGDIENILYTMDKFARTEVWLMNVGDEKGKILDQAIQSRKPKTILELGSRLFFFYYE